MKDNCHKCGRKGHHAKEYRASTYVLELYREIQKLRNQLRDNYNLDIQHDNNPDIKNFMTVRGKSETKANVEFLDSASTHTILTYPKLFEFSAKEISYVTMAGSRKFKFCKGRAIIGMPGDSSSYVREQYFLLKPLVT